MTNTDKIPGGFGFAVTQGVINRTALELSRQLKFPEHIYADHNKEVRAMIARLATVPKISG